MVPYLDTHAHIPVSATFFGRFSLRVGDAEVDDTLNRSRKMWNILAYLIAHRDRSIPQKEFITMLWGDNGISRGNTNALKTLFYRIRSFVAPLEEQLGAPLILSQRGAYRWNGAVSCQTDYGLFEKLCGESSATGLSDEERERLCRDAFALYRGRFFEKLGQVAWVNSLAAHFHELYLELSDRLAILLAEQKRFPEVIELCYQILEIDSCDERTYCHLIRSLLATENYEEAHHCYEKATDLLYRCLRARPSEALRALSVELLRVDIDRDLETDLWKIRDELGGVESGEEAFVCDYAFFKGAYQLALRRTTRSDHNMVLGLLTITGHTGKLPKLETLNRAMDQLLVILRSSLRRGDIVSRYSGAQFVLLLPIRNYEFGEKTLHRISNLFARRCHLPVELHYKLQVLEHQKGNRALIRGLEAKAEEMED